MKKFFTLVAAALMLSASAQTLDLYNGTAFDYYVPINSQWYETIGTTSQVLYPAADLADMQGKEITSMTFYTDENGCKMNAGLLNIFLGETQQTVLSDYITEGLTQVATASMVKDDTDTVKITINFTTPYMYNGGNLVFSAVVAQAGGYGMTYFMGISTDDSHGITTAFSSLYPRTFLPHTTFTYNAGGEPEVLRGDVNGDTVVNISDVTTLIDLLLANGDMPAAADCSQDGTVNISDVTALIDFILSNKW